jgi:hypothetical protein
MIHELHPEIQRFWEEQGHTIEYLTIQYPDGCSPNATYVWATKEYEDEFLGFTKVVSEPIAIAHPNETHTYCFGGDRYTEQEMLRIIKLKAFL